MKYPIAIARILRAVSAVALLGFAGTAFAGPPPVPPPLPTVRPTALHSDDDRNDSAPMAAKVHVDMMCIRATNSNDKIDPELQSLTSHLGMMKFTGYHLIDQHPEDIAVGDSASFDVEGGRRMKIDVLDRDEKQAKLRIQMFNARDRVLDTTVTIHRNRRFILMGPKIGDDVLVLPVTVEY